MLFNAKRLVVIRLKTYNQIVNARALAKHQARESVLALENAVKHSDTVVSRRKARRDAANREQARLAQERKQEAAWLEERDGFNVGLSHLGLGFAGFRLGLTGFSGLSRKQIRETAAHLQAKRIAQIATSLYEQAIQKAEFLRRTAARLIAQIGAAVERAVRFLPRVDFEQPPPLEQRPAVQPNSPNASI
jgi:hypothetical protein